MEQSPSDKNEMQEEVPDQPKEAGSVNTDQSMDIDAELSNVAEHVEKQENNLEFLFKQFSGTANFNINPSTPGSRANLVFRKVELNYDKDLDPIQSDFIKFQFESRIDAFNHSRIGIFNSSLLKERIVLASIQGLIESSSSNSVALSCLFAGSDYSLEELVDQFIKQISSPSYQKNFDSFYAIIYRKKEDGCRAIDFLEPIIHQGGTADSYSIFLRSHHAYLLFVENDNDLYKTEVRENLHPALLHFSDYHLLLQKAMGQTIECRRVTQLTEVALYEYEWLSQLNKDEKVNRLKNLLQENNLEKTLIAVIESSDKEETHKNILLLKDQLQHILLFTCCFFEGVSLAEFNLLVKVLIQNVPINLGDQEKSAANDQVRHWEANADDILRKCGIVVSNSSGGHKTLKFESEARKINLTKLFTEDYFFALIHRAGIIESSVLFQEVRVSGQLIRLLSRLILLNASNDNAHQLINLSERLVDNLLEDQEESSIKMIFHRLVIILKAWSTDTKSSKYLNRFYTQLIKSAERRNMMGAIMTHVCEPSSPQNLVFLKMLLESAGEEENYIRYRVPRLIVGAYSRRLFEYFDIIEKWKGEAYYGSKGSVLLVFYEKRFSWTDWKGLDYILLISILRTGKREEFRRFIEFLFSADLSDVFSSLFNRLLHRYVESKKLLEKSRIDGLYTFLGFLLIQLEFLISRIVQEGGYVGLSRKELIREIEQTLNKNFELDKLKSFMNRCIQKYNLQMVTLDVRIPKEKERRNIYKEKREGARRIMEEIEAGYEIK